MNTAAYYDGEMKTTFITHLTDLGLVDYPADVNFGDQTMALYMKDGKTVICTIINQEDSDNEPQITFKA